MIPLSLESLQEYLSGKELGPETQKETNQLVVILKIKEKEFPLFFRIFEEGNLLQMLVFIPTSIKNASLNDTARLLHLINKELDIPGFGIEEDNKIIFYRLMIPAPSKKVDVKVIEMLLSSLEKICETFTPIIHAVATQNITFEEVLKRAKNAK
jgi:hypothetical protein